MSKENYYHGTYLARGDKFLSTKVIDSDEVSVGDRHWLGDGHYLFIEDYYAYKWIVDMYQRRFNVRSVPMDESLFSEYIILLVELDEKTRFFDLTLSEYKVEFDEVYTTLSQQKQYSSMFQECEIADGIIINYMFNEIGFNEDFDAVKAFFSLNKNQYYVVKSRISHMPQTQICIKNTDVVKDITKYDCKQKIPLFMEWLEKFHYNQHRNRLNGINNTYRAYRNNPMKHKRNRQKQH